MRFFFVSIVLLGISPGLARAAGDAAPSTASPAPADKSADNAAEHPADKGTSGGDVDKANNPLATLWSVNFQDYYTPTLSGVANASTNSGILRVSTPFWRILPRVSLPMNSISQPGVSVSGLGDLQAFANFLFTSPESHIQFGAGPLYIAPTATDQALGSGKHQLGGSAVLVAVIPGFVTGTLVQYQLSFAGDSTRSDVESLTAQIFAIAQVGGGYYLRSTPTATFDVQNGNYNVPIGVGAGKVFKIGSVVANLFLEPQYVILSHGLGQPAFQIFSGINTQFAAP